MKVFLHPTGLHSRAMLRVAEALIKYAPSDVTFAAKPAQADVQVLHVISEESCRLRSKAPEYVAIQYCLKSAGGNEQDWKQFWHDARFVWSYYDLSEKINGNSFYFSPLGVDGSVFRLHNFPRHSVVTSGFVSGVDAEPIEEMALAAEKHNLQINHVGPPTIQGMNQYPKKFKSHLNILDSELVDLYNSALWVSAMRHTEGFEMPAIEGLACGARPICFDRPDMHQWYNGHAVFVPESSGDELLNVLTNVLHSPPAPVTILEREQVLQKFSWPKIAKGFWQKMNV
jgi:hypothetical protein